MEGLRSGSEEVMPEPKRLIDRGCSIKETAKVYDTTIDTLYYYERLGLVVPERNPANGYRIYGPHDFAKLNVIFELRSMGFSFDQMKRYFDHRSFSSTMELMGYEMDRIDQQIAYLSSVKAGIFDGLKLYTQAVAQAQADRMTIERKPERPCALISSELVYYDDIPFAFARYMADHHESLRALRTLTCYRVDTSSMINGCFPAKAIMLYCDADDFHGNYRLPAGLYAGYTFKGSFAGCVPAYTKLKGKIEREGYRMCGDPIEFCLIGEYESDDFREYVSRIEIPVEPAGESVGVAQG
ncbi:MerR family transcriptional regulator [Bifidobacterium xylocopae]|nr:MerR family transcriptional regulator [Bifidobacterium xylocopae]